MEKSKQPYYFMSGMAYLEKELGNYRDSIGWYKKAWENSVGQATRIQWGSNYLLNVVDLAPEDSAEIQRTGKQIIRELSEQKDGLHQSSRKRLDRINSRLIEWADEDPENAERQAVLDTLRGELDQLCKANTDPENQAFCTKFLIDDSHA